MVPILYTVVTIKTNQGDEMDKSTEKKACSLGLIRKIEREGVSSFGDSGYEAYETLCDYTRNTYPDFSQDDIEDCVMYAMQAVC
jgi:hypothetical protein